MSKTNISLFSQILAKVDRGTCKKISKKYDSDKYSKGISSWTHLASMLFMQLGGVNSVRDISNGLKSATGNLNHVGIDRAPSKSTISYINKHRDYRYFKDLYFELLTQFEPSLIRQRQYASRIKRKVYIMDSSIVPLCMSLFDWAKFRTKKGAIKLHAVLDYDSGLPNYAYISEGKTHDINVAREMVFPSDSVVIADRAYVDYGWLNNLDSRGVKFVIRLKSNAGFKIEESWGVNEKYPHILSDGIIRFTGPKSGKKYSKSIRLVKVYDQENDQTLCILTNNMSWTANTISELYKARWDIEVFFKHLKQLFRIKSFIGTSTNAVRIQMWSSMIAMLLLRYFKKIGKFNWHLSNLITFIRINLFAKPDLYHWLDRPIIEVQKPPPQNTLF
jgi:hypothetical protein